MLEDLYQDRLEKLRAEHVRIVRQEISEADLIAEEKAARSTVMELRKAKGTDVRTLQTEIQKLRRLTMKLILHRHGNNAIAVSETSFVFRVTMHLLFPRLLERATPRIGSIVIETAPLQMMPHSVYAFLETISQWQGGVFDRNTNRLVQVSPHDASSPESILAFPEYSNEFPHTQGTLGFAGHPGGPSFYINTVDNTIKHGPGEEMENVRVWAGNTNAQSCFARVIKGEDLLEVLHNIWGEPEQGFHPDWNGYINDPAQTVAVLAMTIN